MKNILCVTLVTCLIFGCGYPAYNSGDLTSYRSAIRSGRVAIKSALEIEKQFPKTEHIIIMYGGTGSDKHEWQTVSCFGGRYELTMTQNVVLSSNGEKVLTLIDEPTFIMTVCKAINPTGGASLDGSREQKFGMDKWEAFKASGYDLKVLDPAYDGSVLPSFEEYANEWQKSRRIWR